MTAHAFELKEFDSKAAYEEAIVALLEKYDIGLVCLAGYMKIVGPTLLKAYKVVLSIFIQLIFLNFQVLMAIEDAWNCRC